MNTSLLQSLDQDYIVNEIVKDQPHGGREGEPAIIKVIGVGGGGSNAVNYMFENKITDVEFAVCNTDRQSLAKSPVPVKIQLGATLTQGLGAGTDAVKGKEAALETIEEIKGLLGGSTQMVFITAGMGGGTGTGAAPVIAQLAREMGKLTVAVVTAPYTWEGLDKKEQALEGIEQLKKYCDTVLVVLNDKLEELFEDMTITQAFAQADGILLNAVKSISEIITTSGNINTDFKDVEKVLKGAGQSVMGTSESTGSDRAQTAIKEALDSPLLNDRDIRGAKRILVTLATSKKKEATMKEQREIWSYVLSQVGGEARMFKLGTITDESLSDKLRVTIVAAGFDSVESPIPGTKLNRSFEVKAEDPYVTGNFMQTIPEPEVLRELEMTSELEEATPTGHADIVLEDEPVVTSGFEKLNNTLTESEDNRDWADEESERIGIMVNAFRDKQVKMADLEGPAYRRSRVELWKKPTMPATEMEQHWLR
ncbi:cell division protein FtsZ [Dyadobacter luticola]|uniref:Cell division protein FtsZ n=1 Tax=Dyadobacter luticola TaxID=1979387 RepID=A0A5R9KPH2_9BACT|nr:cell division protein FtsZ [Dyadobacter luticola]TLU98090.1 cell division protein FtsZ [Dyadobacter luticola]